MLISSLGNNFKADLRGDYDIAIGAGGAAFVFRAGQIGHSVANGSPPLRRFFEVVLPRRHAAELGLTTRYTFCSIILRV